MPSALANVQQRPRNEAMKVQRNILRNLLDLQIGLRESLVMQEDPRCEQLEIHIWETAEVRFGTGVQCRL